MTKRITKNSIDKFEKELYLRFKKNEKDREERFMQFEKEREEREMEYMRREKQRQREREKMETIEITSVTSDEESEEEVTEDDEDDDTIYCQICSRKYDDINKRTGPKEDRSCHYCCTDCFKQCMQIKKQGRYYVNKYTCFWCEGIHYFELTPMEIWNEMKKEEHIKATQSGDEMKKQSKKQNSFWKNLNALCFIVMVIMISTMYTQ
jgi:hypothetical protein